MYVIGAYFVQGKEEKGVVKVINVFIKLRKLFVGIKICSGIVDPISWWKPQIWIIWSILYSNISMKLLFVKFNIFEFLCDVVPNTRLIMKQKTNVKCYLE